MARKKEQKDEFAKGPKVKKPRVKEPIKEPVKEAPATGPKWIKVTFDEMNKLQDEGKLMGYKPSTSEALVK